MNAENGSRPGRGAWLALALLAVVVVIGVLVVARRQRAPTGPRVLNQRTAAREVRPLRPGPDPHVAPLPIEREKHGQ